MTAHPVGPQPHTTLFYFLHGHIEPLKGEPLKDEAQKCDSLSALTSSRKSQSCGVRCWEAPPGVLGVVGFALMQNLSSANQVGREATVNSPILESLRSVAGLEFSK